MRVKLHFYPTVWHLSGFYLQICCIREKVATKKAFCEKHVSLGRDRVLLLLKTTKLPAAFKLQCIVMRHQLVGTKN